MNQLERAQQTVDQLQAEHRAILKVCERLQVKVERLVFRASQPMPTDPDELTLRVESLIAARLALGEATAVERWKNNLLTKAIRDLAEAEREAQAMARYQIDSDPELSMLMQKRHRITGSLSPNKAQALAAVNREIEKRLAALNTQHTATLAATR